MSYVLIISNSQDIHSDVVENRLREKNVRVIRFNTDEFISSGIKLSFNLDISMGYISTNNDKVNFSEISSVWYRRPGVIQTNIPDLYQREFAEKECDELVKQLYFSLDNALWVSKYSSLERARRKLPQLLVARDFGFEVPKTLITNSACEVRDFFKDCNGKTIYKTLRTPVIKPSEGPELWGIPTTLLTDRHIESIELIENTGGIFQEYIAKQYEVRVTIIGKDIFAVKIDSQSEDSAKIDWRDAVAFGKVKVLPHELPADIAEKCKRIISTYGLEFGAIDLILTPENKYIFLEVNCNGQWLWVEEYTNQPLIESMANLLIKNQ